MLQWSKPLLVFLTGCWFVLYLMNRRTRTAPLTRRVLVALALLGVVAIVDAAVEGAYLIIPKQEEFPDTGCCTAVLGSLDSMNRLPPSSQSEGFGTRLQLSYYAVNLAMALTLTYCILRPRWQPSSAWHAVIVLGTLIALGVSQVFLREVVAPALLHLPYHHCVYDLVVQVPESVVGIGLFLLGVFAVGWSCGLGWFGQSVETTPMLREAQRELLRFGLFGYVGSMVMVSVALALV
jgi:hypothetical protein